MTSKPPSSDRNSKPNISRVVTRAVRQLRSSVNFNALNLRPGKQVPELRIKEANAAEEKVYPLLGDRYTLGRSSRCDIQIRDPLVSQTHLTIKRNKKNPRSFIIQDEQSTNGTYRGKKRFKTFSLYHGESFTIGPPELAAAISVKYYNPPPLWLYLTRYSLYGMSGIFGLLLLWIGLEWSKVPVYPLPRESTRPVVVYARDGETLLNPVSQNTHRELKNLSDFSSYLPQAVIASEDSRYYWHLGVDPIGITRAIVINFTASELRQGASTITQQLARSLFPEVGRENTAGRKIREMLVALKLETAYSKNEILKTYLNRVYLGIGSYGFEDAAQFYFEKSAADLDLSEAASLVAILPAPNLYNPVKDYQTAVALRNRIIDRMVKLKMVDEAEADRARRSRIEVSPTARETLSNTPAPYFYAYVLDELQTLLGADVANEGNFIVETGFDPELQEFAETALEYSLDEDGNRFGYSQGAVVTMDNLGEIRALVGGADYNESQFNRVVQAKRQPGSTFKTFAYAAALEQGIDPDTDYSCSSVTWKGQNYRGCERSSGDIDMYRGLAQSENAVTLRVAQEVGLDRIIELAKNLGVTSPLVEAPGLVLGQSETSVLEMTGAYAAIANGGIWNKPHAIKRILDGSDCQNPSDRDTCREIYVFEDDEQTFRDVLSEKVTNELTDMLEEAVENGTGKAAYLDEGEAGKTGTTDNSVDLWFIGFLPQPRLVTGIWLGNDDNSPTTGSSYQAAALWGRYMNAVIDKQ
jgi:penicillin-binding protein 1A